MNHEPMPGRREREWCPVCNAPSGLDCPGRYRSKRAARRAAGTEIDRQIAEAAS